MRKIVAGLMVSVDGVVGAPAWCTVYSYDRRGRGDSGDMPPYAVEREIEDLAALPDARLIERRGLGHAKKLTPKVIAATLTEFLTDTGPQSSTLTDGHTAM